MKRRPAFVVAVAIALGTLGPGLATPPAQIAVSPSRFELSIGGRSTTESISLMNMGREDVTVEISTASWDLDEANSVRIIPPDEQSLDQWLVINPLRFTILGGRSQTVRFSIRPRILPSPGEHRAMIYFNQVLPEGSSDKKLRVKFSIGVAVYGFAGDVTRSGTLHTVRFVGGTNPVAVRFDVSSEGNAHVRMKGQYAVYPAGEYPGVESTTLLAESGPGPTELPEPILVAGSLPGKPILPGTRRELVLQTSRELPPGNYVLDLNGDLAGNRIDIAIPFTIPAALMVEAREADALP